MTTNGFEMWGIVEIMGHQRCAGKLSEQSIAGAAMLRVDVPKTPEREGFTKFYSSAAIYAITPTDEATATKAAIAFEVTPIQEYILRVSSPALAEKINIPDDDSDYGYGIDDGESDDGDSRDSGWINVATLEDEDEPDEGMPTSSKIVRMERDQTSNSKSPMWRCLTDDGERVNIFKHTDPKKNSFRHFAEAGYAEAMEAMQLGDVLTWKQTPVIVDLIQNGAWREVTSVLPNAGGAPDAPKDDPKTEAAKWAKTLVDADDFLVLDTETTGLDKAVDQPVSIAVVSAHGTVLLDTLMKPSVPINPEASAIHHITEDMLNDAPRFSIPGGTVMHQLRSICTNRKVLIYNAEFDAAMLANANHHIEALPPEYGIVRECVMLQYAKFYGDMNYRTGDYRWQSLTNACEQQGITGIEAPAHSALGDCLRTLALVKVMAAYEAPKTNDHPF